MWCSWWHSGNLQDWLLSRLGCAYDDIVPDLEGDDRARLVAHVLRRMRICTVVHTPCGTFVLAPIHRRISESLDLYDFLVDVGGVDTDVATYWAARISNAAFGDDITDAHPFTGSSTIRERIKVRDEYKGAMAEAMTTGHLRFAS